MLGNRWVRTTLATWALLVTPWSAYAADAPASDIATIAALWTICGMIIAAGQMPQVSAALKPIFAPILPHTTGQAALFFGDDGGLAKHYEGLVTMLLDSGFNRDEALNWLFTVQEDLGMHPAQALHTHSAREVIRRGQALAL